MRSSVAGLLARCAAAVLLIAAVVVVYTRWVPVNPTTAALTFLLVIQWVVATWGLRVAVITSVIASLCFNYYFLPPVGAFTIADTQNWVALAAFLATALIGSNLADRLRAARGASEQRGRELELLYDFGQSLLAPESTAELLRALPFSIAAAFHCADAAVYLVEGGQMYATSRSLELAPGLLTKAATSAYPIPGPVPGTVLTPLAIGVRPVGALYLVCGAKQQAPANETLKAVGGLVALSLERAAALEKLVHAEAAAESDRLRAALLDAVTHDLRTPLTSIKASVTALQTQGSLHAEQREDLLAVIDEESDRLDRLISRAVEMAELDAKAVRLEPRAQAILPLLEESLEQARTRWPERVFTLDRCEPGLTALVDGPFVGKVLLHLLENAAKYAPVGTPVTAGAALRGAWAEVWVRDQGPGIAPEEQERIFEKFYRGSAHRFHIAGTGMGLAIARAITEAQGGRLTVESEPGSGTVFTCRLPSPGAGTPRAAVASER